MKVLGNAVVAHGGGPTAVLNASLAGVADAWAHQGGNDKLYGALFGVSGILKGDFLDLSTLPSDYAHAPGSAIGSSRQALNDDACEAILRTFRERDIRFFFYTGGNGSMDTALRLSKMARDRGDELQVIGIPKTIDNDLSVTDHAPGYPSAARFFIHAARDIGLDNKALPSPICVLEVLGRNTGWLAAATALARTERDDAPHLIYFPEHRVSLDQIASDVEQVYRRLGRAVIAICEGQLDDKGLPFGAEVDRPGSAVHRLASNLGHTLALALTEKLGLRARAEKPGLFGRSCAALASPVDRSEAYGCGRAAVGAARHGATGMMVTLRRTASDPYQWETGLAPLEDVARIERPLPPEWIAPGATGAHDVGPGFRDYLLPLIGRLA